MFSFFFGCGVASKFPWFALSCFVKSHLPDQHDLFHDLLIPGNQVLSRKKQIIPKLEAAAKEEL